jgi:hypothetical protein
MSQIARASVFVTTALALTACGGGGGGGLNFIPAPPVTTTPTSTPTPAPPQATASPDFIIAAAVPDQPFSNMGGIVRPDSNEIPVVSTVPADQAQLRYDSAAAQYQIIVPAGSSWENLFYNPDSRLLGTHTATSPSVQFTQSAATGYRYSALAALFLGPSPVGVYAAGNAFGIPTPAGAVPTTGSATYNGSITGFTTETVSNWGAWGAAQVDGNIALSFNFGAGTLAGTISPTIHFGSVYALDPLSFTNTTFAQGGATFFGQFATTLPGGNAFSGQFTGPAAQELIGSFLFPYTSHDDGKIYQATGAFVGK